MSESTPRPQAEIVLLMRARAIAERELLTIGQDVLPPHDCDYSALSDTQALSAAFGIIAVEQYEMRQFRPDLPGRCGWCIAADGNDQAAWDRATAYDDVSTHTVTCSRNPVVVDRDRLLAEIEQMRFDVARHAATLVKWAVAAGGHTPSAIIARHLRDVAGPDAVEAVRRAIEIHSMETS